MNRKFKYNGFLIVIFFFILGIVAISSESHAQQEKIRVAVFNYENFMTEKPDGTMTGYAYDYLMKIAEYTGWEYEYVHLTLSDALKKLDSGEIDMIPGIQDVPDIYAQYDLSKHSLEIGGTMLCVLQGDTQYAYNDFSRYENMRIGVLKDSSHIRQAKQLFEREGVRVNFVEYETHELSVEALKRKEIDSILVSSIRCSKEFTIIANISSDSVCFALNKKNIELKSQLDTAIDRIHMDTPFYEHSLIEKYYGDSLMTHAYTYEELQYIEKNPVVRVGIRKNMIPLEYYDRETQSYCGIVPDMFRRLEERSGLHFVFTGYETEEEKQALLKSGIIEVLPVVSCQGEVPEMPEMKVTNAYLNTPMVVIFTKNYTGDLKIGMVKNKFLTNLILENTEGRARIIYYETTGDCIEAARKGEIDCAFASTYEADYYLTMPKYATLNFRSQIDFDVFFSMAVYTEAGESLYGILEKSLEEMSTDIIRSVISQNTQNEMKFSVIDMIYTNPVSVMLGVAVFLTVCLGCVVLLILYSANQKQNILLQKSNESKTNFLSMMSHEIRTPLSAIIGINKLIGKTTQEESIRKYSEKIQVSSDHLLQLINDILDMNKINEGKMELYPAPFSFGEILHTLKVVYAEAAAEKGMEFKLKIYDCEQDWYLGDALRIKQVLINLISNAMKYNRENGEIRLSVRKILQDSESASLKIGVSDTGIGIAQENLNKIFDAFEREKRIDVNEITGSGLGLSISSELVKMMGSRLKVESELGQGSHFYFTLRLPFTGKKNETGGKAVPAQPEEGFLKGKECLIVEDNDINAEIIRLLLESQGAGVTRAENGKRGTVLFEQSKVGFYCLILMDIRMPVMDGYEATKYIRNSGRADASQIPIIALSANAFEEDRRQSLEAGMNAHLSKPINTQELYKELHSFLHIS